MNIANAVLASVGNYLVVTEASLTEPNGKSERNNRV